MVKLDAVRAGNASLVQSQPLVAAFFGGTGTIASQTLRELAKAEGKYAGKGLRAYVVGRDAKSAEEVIKDCQKTCPSAEVKFIQAGDMSLMKEVDRLCATVTKAEEEQHVNDARIDYLMIAQGGMIFQPRNDTEEGIDKTMSLMYYSRMRIILNLIPLLLKSTVPASPTIVSVYAAGSESKLYLNDLSLRDLKIYNYSLARSHMCFMHSLFFEALAQKYPGKFTMIHIFPGLVVGPGYYSPELPAWFRILFHGFIKPVFGRWITVKPSESGERMMSLAAYPSGSGGGNAEPTASKAERVKIGDAVTGTNGKPGSGVYSLTWSGESKYPAAKYDEAFVGTTRDEVRQKVWDHVNKAFEVIEKGEVFKE